MSNMNIDTIQQKIPNAYAKYENKSEFEKSILYAILNAFASTIDDNNSIIDRVDAMIGIDTTYDEDLEYRWGNLLGINKVATESYHLYRNRLKLAIPSMIGGTKSAIKYAIATSIGIEKDDRIRDDYIDVVDGWEYDGDIDVPDEYKQYGCFICIIDLSISDSTPYIEQKIIDAINSAKASGTAFYVVYKALALVDKYYDMDMLSYSMIGRTTYASLGI